MGVLVVTSVLCALAPTVGTLIACRVLQGVGGGLVLANVMAEITALFPKQERRRAMAVNASILALAQVTGLVLGGLLISQFGWRSLFLVILTVSLAGLILSLRILRARPRSQDRTAMDWTGAVLAVVATSAPFLVIEQLSQGGLKPASLVILLGGAAALALFVAVEQRRPQPLLTLSLFRSRAYICGSVAAAFYFVAAVSCYCLLPLYAQLVLVRADDGGGADRAALAGAHRHEPDGEQPGGSGGGAAGRNRAGGLSGGPATGHSPGGRPRPGGGADLGGPRGRGPGGSLRHHDPAGVRFAVVHAGATAGDVVRGEGAEGGIDPVDAGERCQIDPRLLQQRPPLAALLGGLGVAAAPMPGDGVGKGFEATGAVADRQRGGERMAGREGLIERFAAQHPAEVVGGVAGGGLAGGRGEADDPLPPQLPLAGTGVAIDAPAAGGIDGDHAGLHHGAAPVGELLRIGSGQPGGVGAASEGHGVEALAGPAHIDAHGGEAGGIGGGRGGGSSGLGHKRSGSATARSSMQSMEARNNRYFHPSLPRKLKSCT